MLRSCRSRIFSASSCSPEYAVIAFYLALDACARPSRKLFLALILVTWYWGIKDNMSALTRLISENIAFQGGFHAYHQSVYFLYGFFLFLVGIASLYMMGRFQSLKTDAQKLYQVLFYMFLGGILFYVFVARYDPSALVYIAFPVSYILSFYFHRKKSTWIHEVFIWILLGLVVYVQLMV